MFHRRIEWVAVLCVAGLLVALALQTWIAGAAVTTRATGIAVAVLMFFAAQLVADFLSGLAHWLADCVLSESTPVLGAHFVRPFREHHDDPESITQHDFVETNGNTCILVAPLLVLAIIGVASSAPSLARSAAGGFAFFLASWLCLTNQLHRLAHTADRPDWLRALEATRMVLNRAHHARHHVAPFDTHFCITTGWLNPLLDRFGVFKRLEREGQRPVPLRVDPLG